jgi:hypothetical protein
VAHSSDAPRRPASADSYGYKGRALRAVRIGRILPQGEALEPITLVI